MIISPKSVQTPPTDGEMGHSGVEHASLQMLMHDNLPINLDGEVECLNL